MIKADLGPSNGQKVFIGLSGGVDSAVAALLLQQAGYEVTGVFMKNYSEPIMVNGQQTECWVPEWHDALRVAAHLKIPLLKFDFEEIYRREVLGYLYAEYAAGRTPNPDVLCNSQVKFGPFFAECRRQGADFIATGHYAQNRHKPEFSASLLRAKDENKDQTYFLHQVDPAVLAHTLFPIGHLTKPEVRELARAHNLPVAEKKDSTGICFVGEVSIREFLRDKIKSVPGEIITTNGEVAGQHDGLAWYTIGQRHGFGGGGGRPWYVVKKDMANNQLIIAEEYDPALFTKKILVEKMHWLNRPAAQEKLWVRLRHRQPLQAVESIQEQENGQLIINTVQPQRAVTPGQFAVLYNKEECFGGGVVV